MDSYPSWGGVREAKTNGAGLLCRLCLFFELCLQVLRCRDCSPVLLGVALGEKVIECLVQDIDLISVGNLDYHAVRSFDISRSESVAAAVEVIMAPPPLECKPGLLREAWFLAPMYGEANVKQPISVAEAAKILGISDVAVLKRIKAGRLLAVSLSGKGLLVCHESVLGKNPDPAEFRRVCERWISVPQACNIVCVTDAMIGRMLLDGRLKGFRLNEKAWAVDKASCEQNIREYLANPPTYGRPRRVGDDCSPKKRRRKTA